MKMNRSISLILVILMLLSLSGCMGMVEKDVLTEYNPSTSQNPNGGKTSVVIEDYSVDYTGNLLAYNPWSNTSIYYNNTQGSISESVIYTDTGEEQKIINTTSNRYVDAHITQSGYVYFKERDSSSNEYVYMVDPMGEKKTLLANSTGGKNIAWSVSELNTFVYVDSENNIKINTDGNEEIIFTLPTSHSVSKIRYCERAKVLMVLSTDATASVLNRINLTDNSITAVDVNVTDMSVVTSANKTAYLKTDSRGQKQLYVYDHNTLLRTYVMTGNIDRFSLSPYGGYVAFEVRATETNPTQSVWIVNCRDFANVQVTSNTALASGIYWTASEKELLFTNAETNSDPEVKSTIYRTYRLKFKYEYSGE